MTEMGEKVAIVTGGAGGLGAGLCRQLAAEGALVVIADLGLEQAQTLAGELVAGGHKAEARRLDVTDRLQMEELVTAVVANHGRLDFMFNNAGVGVGGEFKDVDAAAWQKIVDVNLMGTVWGSRAAYAQMLKQGSGHIVNIASMWGLCPGVMQSAYTATKHAVVGMSQAMRMEARAHGIKVTAVCPGYVRTGLFAAASMHSDKHGLDDPEALIPFSFMEVDQAVAKALAGVRRNRAVVAFPAYVRVMRWLQGNAPWLLALLMGRELKKLRGAP